ncbi:MAG: DNA internalization-related competence protein ComEC/Rec2 [Gemmatimonadota bacterium]
MVLGLAVLGSWHRWPTAGAVLLIALLGRLAALTALAESENSCAALLPGGQIDLTVRLNELPDWRGGLLEVSPVGGECQGSILARWPAGDTTLTVGRDARARGRWIPDTVALGPPSGILLVETVRPAGGMPGLSDRLRTAITRRIRSLYGSRAGVVEALILNHRASMSPEVRQRYARSGLVHLLSISGFHVGLIAAWVLLLGRPLAVRYGPPGSIAKVPMAAAVVAAAYVAFLGWPPPAARAALLVLVLALERFRQRRIDSDSLLAFTALVLLALDPWCITSLGAWLSFLSLWGASRAVRWSDSALAEQPLIRVVAGSVGATLATAPLTAAVLGMVSLAGIILNLVAIPLAAVALPGVLASVLVAPVVPPLAAALADGSGLGLAGLDGLASVGAAIPGLAILQPAEPVSAVPWLALLAAAIWGTWAGVSPALSRARWLAIATAAAWLILLMDGMTSLGARDEGLTLHFLDVGQGDAALIHTPADQWVVIDAGPRGPSGDAGRDVVVPELARHGAHSVAAMVLSHPHLDHIGGAAAVLASYPVGFVIEPGDEVADSVYLGLLDRVAERGSRWRAARNGDTLTVDSVRFIIVHPDPSWPDRGLDLNEDSAVLRLEFGGCRILFSGDAGFDAEAVMTARVGAVDLLKVGHHGSHGASGEAWLSTLDPAAAVISVGARNRYGHPSPETLARLAQHQIPVWRTDQDGEITVRVHDHGLEISSRRATTRLPCHSTDS